MKRTNQPTLVPIRGILSFLLSTCFLFSPNFVLATPIITSTLLRTMNVGPNPHGFTEGWSFNLRATIRDSEGVPGTISSVFADSVDSDEYDYNLYFINPIQPVAEGMYGTSPVFPAYTGQLGQWSITVTDTDGDTATRLTHVLDHPFVMPLVSNIQFSDYSLTPTITWDPVLLADGYEVYLWDNNVNQFFYGTMLPSTSTTFVVPEGLLNFGVNYFVRIDAVDIEVEGTLGFSENASTMYVGFTPVPEPATLCLLGSGLFGLAQFGRKIRKR